MAGTQASGRLSLHSHPQSHKSTAQFWIHLTTICVISLAAVTRAQDSNPDPPLEGPVLTPWWPLKFGAGEKVEIDCGVFTGGHVGTTIQWISPNGEAMDTKDRITIRRQDTNHRGDKEQGAYSVMTLTVANLTQGDSGDYTCRAGRTGSDDTTSTNISLNVVPKGTRFGFESPDLGGWTVRSTEALQWRHHSGEDALVVLRSKGARFDHTYGSSKTLGHFMDVDPQHDPQTGVTNANALLVSPVFPKHETFRCLQYWFVFEGRDQGHLEVKLHALGAPEGDTVSLHKTVDGSHNEWRLQQVKLPPQPKDYHIMFEASVCPDVSCRLAATSIDDVIIADGKCTNETTEWPDNTLRVRLVGGSNPSSGRVEVLHNGQWGTVCSRKFGDNDARVICKAMGKEYDQAEAIRNASFGRAPTGSLVWLDRLACSGKERDLGNCLVRNETWAGNNCAHSEDAGVICKNAEATTTALQGPTANAVSTSTTKKTTTTTPTTTPTPAPTPAPPTPHPSKTPTTRSVMETHAPHLGTPTHPSDVTKTMAPSPTPSTAPLVPHHSPEGAAETATPTQRPHGDAQPAAASPASTDGAHAAGKYPESGTKTNVTAAPVATTTNVPVTRRTVLPTTTVNTTTASTSTKTASSTLPTTTRNPGKSDGHVVTPPPASVSPPSVGPTSPSAKPVSPPAKHVSPSPQATSTTLKPRAAPGVTSPTRATPSASHEEKITQNPIDLEQLGPGTNNAGVAIGIIFTLIIAGFGVGLLLWRKKRQGKKSTYITFGNPSYSREHLPANDFSLESPLTLSSSGYTVLA